MEKIVNFIVANWQYLSIALVVLIELLSIIFRKRSKCVVADSGIITNLIDLVNEAEDRFKLGEEKEKFVIEKFKENHPYWLQELKELDASLFTFRKNNTADDVLRYFIDIILSTPTKKGGRGREKDVEKSK